MTAGKTINEAFAKAWECVDNPPLDSVNPHFKNKFASLGATLGCIRKACEPLGIAYMQVADFEIDGGEAVHFIRTWVQDKDGGRIDLSRMYMPTTENPQQQGSIITYYKRYVAQMDWCIVGEEDDDAERAMPQQQPKPARKAAQQPQAAEQDDIAALWQECIDLGVKKSGLNSWYESAGYKGKKLSQLTAAERKRVKAYLISMRETARQVL